MKMPKATIVSVILLLLGCEEGVPYDGSIEEKPKSKYLAYGIDNNGALERKRAKLATVDYDFSLKSASEIVICRGQALVQLFSDFSLEFGESNLKCGSFTIDIEKLVAKGDLIGKAERSIREHSQNIDEVLKNFSHDGYTLYAERLGDGVRFEPARPLVIGPLIADASKYEGYEQVVETTLTVDNDQLKETQSGAIKLQVLEHDAPYKGAHDFEGLDHTMHWRMQTKGFEGIPPQYGLLIKRIDLWYNFRPIMIPKIEIEFAPADFIALEEVETSETIDDLIGDVTITIELNNYQLGE